MLKHKMNRRLLEILFAVSTIPKANHPEDKYSWIMEAGKDEPGYWEIKGKYAGLKDLTEIGIVYRIGDTVVLSEIR